MKTAQLSVVLAMMICGLALQAQSSSIPFADIQHESQQQQLAMVAATATRGYSSSAAPSLGVAVIRPVPPRNPRVLDRKFMLLSSVHLGMALADVGLTQHCLAEHQCSEANPLMPSSRAGQLSIGLGGFAYATAASYWLKKHRSRLWWTPPAAGVATHIVGVASGIAH